MEMYLPETCGISFSETGAVSQDTRIVSSLKSKLEFKVGGVGQRCGLDRDGYLRLLERKSDGHDVDVLAGTDLRSQIAVIEGLW